MLPHIWCSGCGNGIVLNALTHAFDLMDCDQDNTVVVSGIGCSSRATGYLDFSTLHTTHGRALAFATGVKMARPELKVFVLMGDGDCAAIGGNHFIHAARRNIDLTAIIFNNRIYGMTGGQSSPLTPLRAKSSTATQGTLERPFDITELARAAGATYVARGITYHAKMLSQLIKNGAEHKGFSVIEAVTGCPTYYARRNKMGSGYDLLLWQKEHAVSVERAKKLSPEEMEGKFVIVELYKADAPEFTSVYEELIKERQKKN